jgi:hypothetical protein
VVQTCVALHIDQTYSQNSTVTLVNPIPRGWLLDWNQAPVLTTSSLGYNYRAPEGHQIPLPTVKDKTVQVFSTFEKVGL